MKFNLLVGYVAVRSEISVLLLKKEIRILGGYRQTQPVTYCGAWQMVRPLSFLLKVSLAPNSSLLHVYLIFPVTLKVSWGIRTMYHTYVSKHLVECLALGPRSKNLGCTVFVK